MPNHHYILTHSLTSWQQSLESLARHLPDGIDLHDGKALADLPIFAVVMVIENSLLAKHAATSPHAPKHPDTLVQAWADDNNWAAHPVPTELSHAIIHAPKEATAISDVAVFRYAMMPKNPALISPARKEVAARLLDEQLTTYLSHRLAVVQKPLDSFDLDRLEQLDSFNPPKMLPALDCHILSISQMLRRHKLACFDMDSTLIRQEVIVELAKMAGVGDEVNAITEATMRGEMDFATSFARRVGMLAGVPETIIDEVKAGLIPSAGAFITIAALKAMGYRTVLISGGFNPFAEHIAHLLGMDDYYANPLEVADGKLTGAVSEPILTGHEKAAIATRLTEQMGISPLDVICIGDGANDLPMMAAADIGIAYHAKPIVQAKADVAVNITGLEGVLYALGYPALTPKDTYTGMTQ